MNPCISFKTFKSPWQPSSLITSTVTGERIIIFSPENLCQTFFTLYEQPLIDSENELHVDLRALIRVIKP